MKKLKELKEKKGVKVALKVIKAAAIVLLIGFVIVVCLQRFSDNKISFFNFRLFTVISGSMKPKYDIGDVLIAKSVKPEKIKVGDTISYLGKVGDFNGKVITHEVIGIEKDVNNKYVFRAKGLANLVEDPNVHESQLYGKVIYRCAILSFIYRIVSTSIGFYLFIILPLIYIIGSELLATLLEKEEQRRGITKEE